MQVFDRNVREEWRHEAKQGEFQSRRSRGKKSMNTVKKKEKVEYALINYGQKIS